MDIYENISEKNLYRLHLRQIFTYKRKLSIQKYCKFCYETLLLKTLEIKIRVYKWVIYILYTEIIEMFIDFKI